MPAQLSRYGETPRAKSAKQWVFLALAAALVAGVAFLCVYCQAVPLPDLLFVTLYCAYLYICNATVFASRISRSSETTPLSLNFLPFTRLVIALATITTELLPWSRILSDRRNEITALYAPHLFLHMSQVIMELWSFRASIAVPTRVLIPVGFTFYRFRSLLIFYRDAAANFPLEPVHKYFAIALLGQWGFVFVFVLLLYVLPEYFDSSREPRAKTRQN